MRILICDDDTAVIEQLKNYITEFFEKIEVKLPEIASYTNGDELIQTETKADIAFLDVEMPGISGIHIGAKLMQRNPHIKIFIVTSYPDYLDEAMKFHVFRYLSKPIDKNCLFRNLKEAIYQYNMETTEYTVITNDGVFTRQAEEIVCVEALQRKVLIYTLDGIFKSTENMEYWRNTLSLPCFCSPHRSYSVVITVVNSCDEEPAKNFKGDYKTSKKSSVTHGYGIKSIIRVVNKYNGTHRFYYDALDKQFHAVIQFPYETEK